MNGLVRWVPRLILAAAGLHLVVGVGVYRAGLQDIAAAGFVNAIDLDGSERETAFWFEVCGLTLAMLGDLARRAVRHDGRLPDGLGWWLIGVFGPLTAFMPVSGGWLVITIGVLALAATRSADPSPASGHRVPG